MAPGVPFPITSSSTRSGEPLRYLFTTTRGGVTTTAVVQFQPLLPAMPAEGLAGEARSTIAPAGISTW